MGNSVGDIWEVEAKAALFCCVVVYVGAALTRCCVADRWELPTDSEGVLTVGAVTQDEVLANHSE